MCTTTSASILIRSTGLLLSPCKVDICMFFYFTLMTFCTEVWLCGDRFFKDNWMVPIFLHFSVDLLASWDAYKLCIFFALFCWHQAQMSAFETILLKINL